MIHVQNLHHTFGTGPARVEVLHGIDLQIQSGEFVALMGPSGCGKTTLLHILGLITRPTRADSLRLHNTETCRLSDADRTRLRRRHVAFVFQRFNLIPVLSSIENADAVLNLFARFHTELGLTLVLATHNEAVAGRADRILRMKDGMIGEP